MPLKSTFAAIRRSVRVAMGLALVFDAGLPSQANASEQAGIFSVSLAWDANPEPDVVGYRLYSGTESGRYSTVTDVPDQTTATIGLPSAGTYYVVVTASNSAGLESLPSSELVVEVTPVDGEPPVFVTFPKDIVTVPDSPGGSHAVVSWAEPTVTDNVAGVSLSSTHSSGAAFPIGTTTVTYTAVDLAGNLTNESFTVTVGGLEVWRKQTFGADASDPLVAGDDANADGDRWANLGEYALGFDVGLNDGEDAFTQELAEGQHVLRFHHNPYLADVILRVEACGDVSGGWDTVAILQPGAEWSYDAGKLDVASYREGELQKVILISPADQSTARYFKLVVVRVAEP